MRIDRTLMTCLAIGILTGAAAAQMMPAPPKQLNRFAPALGTWEGKGTSQFDPKQEPLPLTARVTFRKILGGFFIEQDLEVEFGMPAKMHVRNIFGWDVGGHQYVMFGMSNNGGSPLGTSVHWVSEKTMMIVQTRLEAGHILATRSLNTFAKDSLSFEHQQSTDGGAFRTVLDGRLKRARKAIDITKVQVLPFRPPAAALKKMEGHFGRWRIKGSVVPMPGMAAMPVTGEETIRPILAGHVHMMHITGDAMPSGGPQYEAYAYVVWLEGEGRLASLSISNFGEMEVARAYALDDSKVVYFSQPEGMDGRPTLVRSIVAFDEKMSRFTVTSDRLADVHPPERSFEATFTRIK